MAAVEFFVDNPFISVMTSLSVSQFWNIGLMQFASVENFNLLQKDETILAEYSGTDEEKLFQANTDIIRERARAIECGFSVLRNPVNGNIILYDVFGRPLHMANIMNVHTGMIYLDIPKEGRQTIYGATGNWFPWICAIYAFFAIASSFFLKDEKVDERK